MAETLRATLHRVIGGWWCQQRRRHHLVLVEHHAAPCAQSANRCRRTERDIEERR